jgi:putative membrane protein
MNIVAQILVTIIALLHVYILFIEMFAWQTRGKKVFAGVLPDDLFAATKVLAANLGLYNGFLAAGLLWGLSINDVDWQSKIVSFFLICIAIAGIYGAITASRKIIFVQIIPAIIALSLLWFK